MIRKIHERPEGGCRVAVKLLVYFIWLRKLLVDHFLKQLINKKNYQDVDIFHIYFYNLSLY